MPARLFSSLSIFNSVRILLTSICVAFLEIYFHQLPERRFIHMQCTLNKTLALCLWGFSLCIFLHTQFPNPPSPQNHRNRCIFWLCKGNIRKPFTTMFQLQRNHCVITNVWHSEDVRELTVGVWFVCASRSVCVCPYLDKVDESGENGTAQHVMILRLFPEQRQVLHQTAYVWPDLIQRRTTKNTHRIHTSSH